MAVPSPDAPGRRRRPLTLGLLWAGLTTVGHTLAWLTTIYWDSSTVEGTLGLFLEGLRPGVLIAFAQFAVLRMQLPAHRWWLWLLVTPLAHAGAYALGSLLWHGDTESSPFLHILHLLYFPLLAFPGLLIGVMQAPLLEWQFKGKRWWLWPVICGLASTASRLVWANYITTLEDLPYRFAAEGGAYGVVTGIGIALLIRGIHASQKNNRTESS